MRVVVPYTRLRPETREALQQSGYEVEYRSVRGAVTKYWDLFFELWDDGQSFVIVEHDVVVRPSTLRALDRCRSGWCMVPYPYHDYGGWYGNIVSFGCTKFSAAFIAEHPDMKTWAEGMDMSALGLVQHHWAHVDMRIRESLLWRGVLACIRHRPLGHLGQMSVNDRRRMGKGLTTDQIRDFNRAVDRQKKELRAEADQRYRVFAINQVLERSGAEVEALAAAWGLTLAELVARWKEAGELRPPWATRQREGGKRQVSGSPAWPPSSVPLRAGVD